MNVELNRLKAYAAQPSGHLNDSFLEAAEDRIDLHWHRRQMIRMQEAEKIRLKQIKEQNIANALDEEEKRILSKYRTLPTVPKLPIEKAMEKHMKLEMKKYKERLAAEEKQRAKQALLDELEELKTTPLMQQVVSRCKRLVSSFGTFKTCYEFVVLCSLIWSFIVSPSSYRKSPVGSTI